MSDASARLSGLNKYLSQEIHKVNGWCVPQLWQTIWPLAQVIGEGPIAEIGVFEGKFFIGLCKTFGVSDTKKATAIDVFDMQQFNLDGAGVGKKEVLLQNAVKLGIAANAVDCMEVDSLALRATEAVSFVKDRGRVAFFSVDGCHEVTHTVRDALFAMEVTENHGIIAIDDYSNPNWPGVQEAIARMYLLNDYSFVPLAVTCNKMLLCSYSYHKTYLGLIRSYIAKHHPDTRMKMVKRFGFDSLTVQPNVQVWSDLSIMA